MINTHNNKNKKWYVWVFVLWSDVRCWIMRQFFLLLTKQYTLVHTHTCRSQSQSTNYGMKIKRLCPNNQHLRMRAAVIDGNRKIWNVLVFFIFSFEYICLLFDRHRFCVGNRFCQHSPSVAFIFPPMGSDATWKHNESHSFLTVTVRPSFDSNHLIKFYVQILSCWSHLMLMRIEF